MSGWIGVDLDGTLAFYDEWRGPAHIGAPIPAMVDRVKAWLAEGKDVRIFTARVSGPSDLSEHTVRFIDAWCLEHLGQTLPVTCEKDYGMVKLYDDRCVQIVPNTGESLGEHLTRRALRCGVDVTEWGSEWP